MNRSDGCKGGYEGLFIFDIWFSSKNSKEFAINVGEYMMEKGFCKDTIYKLTNNCTGGY